MHFGSAQAKAAGYPALFSQATGSAAPAAAAGPPSFNTIFSKLNPAQLQSVADQIRTGTTDVNVSGKIYRINSPQWAQSIQASHPATPAAPIGPSLQRTQPAYDPNAPLPEQMAQQQLAKIDPAREALRTQLAGSYLTPLQQAGGPPSAATLQSYLDLYKQIDPQAAEAQQALGTQLRQGIDLGSQLDPQKALEVEQATRSAQSVRCNIYGTPQMVAEAMTRGQ